MSEHDKTNGCSFVPDWDFKECCDRHDLDYAAGRTWRDKIRADLRLGRCIWNKARWHKIRAIVYTAGVLVFGWRLFYAAGKD